MEFLLKTCCRDYCAGRALRVLLNHFAAELKTCASGYYATVASQHGAWGSLEVCLELLPWQSNQAAAFFAQVVVTGRKQNPRTIESRVLSLLLPHVPNEHLRHPTASMFHRQRNVSLYIVECHLQRNMKLHRFLLMSITWEDWWWILRRNPSRRDQIISITNENIQNILLHSENMQKLIGINLLSNTPLAQVLVDLVVQFT
jgi:hypothetical protein